MFLPGCHCEPSFSLLQIANPRAPFRRSLLALQPALHHQQTKMMSTIALPLALLSLIASADAFVPACPFNFRSTEPTHAAAEPLAQEPTKQEAPRNQPTQEVPSAYTLLFSHGVSLTTRSTRIFEPTPTPWWEGAGSVAPRARPTVHKTASPVLLLTKGVPLGTRTTRYRDTTQSPWWEGAGHPAYHRRMPEIPVEKPTPLVPNATREEPSEMEQSSSASTADQLPSAAENMPSTQDLQPASKAVAK